MGEDHRPAFTFRELPRTGIIHVFEDGGADGSITAICQGKLIGPVTWPLDLGDVMQDRVCRSCLNRVSRPGNYRGAF